MQLKQFENQSGTWLFIVPIRGLELTNAVRNEYKVDRVTFVAATKLPYIWKRLGFPSPVSKIKKRNPWGMDKFFDASDTFATMRLTGNGSEQRAKFINYVKDELAILALSQLAYSRRRNNASPVLAEERSPDRYSYLMMNTGNESWSLGGERTEKFGNLRLDRLWMGHQQKMFFFDLLKIITKEIRVAKSWVEDIRNAAILAGQSQASSDLPQAFLWNMIAIELLLTRQGDRYSESLPRRAEAFIGWAVEWSIGDYEERIRNLYSKRSGLVHAGLRNAIEIEELLFSDALLSNVLINIVKHPKLFRSKGALIEFSEKVQAEHLLGLKPKVIPRTFSFVVPSYSEDDYLRI